MFLHVTALQRCKTTLFGGFPATGGRHLSFLITKVRSRNYLHGPGLDCSLLRSVCSWQYPGQATQLKLQDGSASTHGPSCPRTLHHGAVVAPDFPGFRISDVRQELEGEVLLILLQDRSVPAELGTALRQVGEETPSKIISSTSMPAKPPPARALGTGTEEWTSLLRGGSVWLFDERHPGVTQM